MDWHKTGDRKPKPMQAVLGYWRGSRSFHMVLYFSDDRWWVTTGGFVPPPTGWAIPDRPDF